MKITLSQLRQLIQETVKASSAEMDEEEMIGRPIYDEPMVSLKTAQHIGHGAWPGGWVDEEELEEEDLDNEEKHMPISSDVMEEIVSEGIMLAQLGVLEQFELDMESIQESVLEEAKYKGREVKLGKPMGGDVKKFKVYVKDPKTGNVKKVEFGDPNMEIRRDNPKARKSFRARHGCGTPRASDRTKAAYWSCRMWSKKPVSKILKGK